VFGTHVGHIGTSRYEERLSLQSLDIIKLIPHMMVSKCVINNSYGKTGKIMRNLGRVKVDK
jgi:hypothetical protein